MAKCHLTTLFLKNVRENNRLLVTNLNGGGSRAACCYFSVVLFSTAVAIFTFTGYFFSFSTDEADIKLTLSKLFYKLFLFTFIFVFQFSGITFL